MKNVILMRHADAVADVNDRTRALSLSGLQQVINLKEKVQLNFKKTQLVICSNAKRCRQTFEGISELFSEKVVKEFSDVLYQAQSSQVLQLIRSLPDNVENVFILGHNPALSDFLSVCQRKRFPAGLDTAQVAFLYSSIVGWASAAPNKFEVIDFIRPNE